MLLASAVEEGFKLEFQHYLAIGGGAVILLAIVLYFVPQAKLTVPAILACGLGSLAVGIAVGMFTMAVMGYHWEERQPEAQGIPGGSEMMGKQGDRAASEMRAKMGGGMGNMGGGMGKGGGGMGKGGGGMGKGGGMPKGGGGRGPNSKAQLAALVAKLDVLTRKPLAVELNEEQRAKVKAQLTGLTPDAESLSEEDAKKRLDALLEVLKEHRNTLEEAGFRWPGSQPGGGQPPADTPNPFKEEQNQQHLKSLQGRLAKA